jgi:uncharacterized membrane protein (DUF485 family)
MSQSVSPDAQASLQVNLKRKAILDFGLFGIFFLFYMGAALVQTPLGKNVATLPVMGMPFGLLMSLAIFPVSWLIIIIWFWRAK